MVLGAIGIAVGLLLGSTVGVVALSGPASIAGASEGERPPRLDSDAATPTAGIAFAFSNETEDGRPYRYDPCRPIHYVVREGEMAGGEALADAAIDRLSAATGLRFVDDGTTDALPANGAGQSTAEVWIGWASPEETGLLPDDPAVLGVGGSSYVVDDPSGEYLGGHVILRSSAALGDGFGPGATVGNVLLHELGHLVGLDHVDDPTQLMYPSTRPEAPDGYAAGDLAGLRALGADRGCLS